MAEWEERRPSNDYHRVLAPDGSLTGTPPPLDDDELVKMYRAFIQTRVFEEKIFNLQRRGELSIIARSLGEEATPVGSMAALEPDDWCFLSYRQVAGLFYWDLPTAQYISGLMGYEPETRREHLPFDADDEPAINLSPVYVPIASNIPNAVGAGMVDSFTDSDVVTMAYIGDGATSEGDFYEGLNFAGVFEVPLVTICQNNQWGISIPSHRQSAADSFARKAEAVGIPHTRVDGNDVLAVYEKTEEAVDRARTGGGPTLIECVTYRIVDHNTADEDAVYRGKTEKEYWKQRDPVERFETYLRSENLLDDEKIASIETEMRNKVAEAVNLARDIPRSDPGRMFDNQLRGLSRELERQRQELRAELDGRNPFGMRREEQLK